MSELEITKKLQIHTEPLYRQITDECYSRLEKKTCGKKTARDKIVDTFSSANITLARFFAHFYFLMAEGHLQKFNGLKTPEPPVKCNELWKPGEIIQIKEKKKRVGIWEKNTRISPACMNSEYVPTQKPVIKLAVVTTHRAPTVIQS